MELLTVKDLAFQHEGYFAFKHVTFSLSQNEAVSIIGDNGSGKTSLLETIVGMNYPDSGSAKINPGARVSFMPQLDQEEIDQTVSDYLEKTRQLAGDDSVSSEQLGDLSTFMGMTPMADRKVKNLSLGMRQRVSFLAAVAARPHVLILDAPFSFQNSISAHNMMEIIKDLQSHGSGILISGSKSEPVLGDYFNTQYLLEGKSLRPVVNETSQHYLMSFKGNESSMAITREVAQYSTGNVSGLIELKVPAFQKEKILETMLEMNYLFEGMVKLEV